MMTGHKTWEDVCRDSVFVSRDNVFAYDCRNVYPVLPVDATPEMYDFSNVNEDVNEKVSVELPPAWRSLLCFVIIVFESYPHQQDLHTHMHNSTHTRARFHSGARSLTLCVKRLRK